MKNKKKKTTAKQIKLVINIICLTIFIVSYFFIYEDYVKKAEEINKETDKVNNAITERLNKLEEEGTIREQLQEVNNQIDDIIDSYPANIGAEDNFLFVDEMESAINVKTASINPSDSVVFFETIVPRRWNPAELAELLEEDEEATTTQPAKEDASEAGEFMTATLNTLSMSFYTDYQGFKDMTEYISKYPDHTTIESVAVSSDNSTGVLAGNLVLKRYALRGTGKDYEIPSIDGIDIGIDNIFGSSQD